MTEPETTPRDRLVAMVALMRSLVVVRDTPAPELDWLALSRAAEQYVAAMEAEPDKPVECPCCTKLVTLCVKHYALHEPGKKCSGCREDE